MDNYWIAVQLESNRANFLCSDDLMLKQKQERFIDVNNSSGDQISPSGVRKSRHSERNISAKAQSQATTLRGQINLRDIFAVEQTK